VFLPIEPVNGSLVRSAAVQYMPFRLSRGFLQETRGIMLDMDRVPYKLLEAVLI